MEILLTLITTAGAVGITCIIGLCVHVVDNSLYKRCEKNHPRYFRMIDQNEKLSDEIDKIKRKLDKCEKVLNGMPKGSQKYLSMCKIIMSLYAELKNYEVCFEKRAKSIIEYREKNKIKYW